MRIEANGIEKWYFRSGKDSNRFYAVRQTDLVLQPGKVTVLTGRSGSGKTTLMNIMAGLLKPDGGRILADGQDLYQMKDAALSGFRNQYFGMIPQGADVLPELTVMENILLPRGFYWKKNASASEEYREYAGELLKQMRIGQLTGVPAKELSGGERRRACVARALAGKPEVIFADEPTSDLDDENMYMVLTFLRRAADEGASVMIVTHDREALDYADVKLRMDGGTLVPVP